MARVLVVDDEVGVRTALTRGLRAEGWEVVAVADGRSGLREALTGSFSVIVLDIIMRGLSGYRVLEQLRANDIHTPVLLLSANDGEYDLADGFDLGADAYLVKPFSFPILAAQVRALARRVELDSGRSGQPPLRLGQLAIDPAGFEATWGTTPLALSSREFAVLYALASHPGSTLSKQQLLELAWGAPGAATPNAVEVYIGYLRRKLELVGASGVLRTDWGRGYRLSLPHTDDTQTRICG